MGWETPAFPKKPGVSAASEWSDTRDGRCGEGQELLGLEQRDRPVSRFESGCELGSSLRETETEPQEAL